MTVDLLGYKGKKLYDQLKLTIESKCCGDRLLQSTLLPIFCFRVAFLKVLDSSC